MIMFMFTKYSPAYLLLLLGLFRCQAFTIQSSPRPLAFLDGRSRVAQLFLGDDVDNTEAPEGMGDKEGMNKKSDDTIELTDETISQMIEKTFIQACMQLATGYVDMAKLMVASITAAFDRNMSLEHLIHLVDTCPNNTANRELTQDEIQVRSSWVTVTYLTLMTLDRLEEQRTPEQIEEKSGAVAIPDEAVTKYAALVEGIVKQHLGLTLATSESDDNNSSASEADPVSAALNAYNVKISQLTLQTVKETRLANQKIVDENAVGPPQPNQLPSDYAP